MMPPKQEPDNNPGATWKDWQDFSAPEKSSEFEYSDSTETHIGSGESQKFHYGRTDNKAE